jgi:hypothetical protein
MAFGYHRALVALRFLLDSVLFRFNRVLKWTLRTLIDIVGKRAPCGCRQMVSYWQPIVS